jgi:hypothetical protein
VNLTKSLSPSAHEWVDSRVKKPAAQDADFIDDVFDLELAIETAERRASSVKIMNDSGECKRIKAFGAKAEAQFYDALNRLIADGGEITKQTLESVYLDTLEGHARETERMANQLFTDLELVTNELKRIKEERAKGRSRRRGGNVKRQFEV